MPRKYAEDAVADARALYLKYSGQHFDLIEKEMRLKWPGWSSQNLITHAKNGSQKIGWIEKYSWVESLKLKLVEEAQQAGRKATGLSEAQHLLGSVNRVIRLLEEKITAHGVTDKGYLAQHAAYSKIKIDVLSKLESERTSFETFVQVYGALMRYALKSSLPLARELAAAENEILEQALREYGKEESK